MRYSRQEIKLVAVKKNAVLILFSLISISLFASGHGADVVVSAFLFLVGTVFCVMGFGVLTILNIINVSRPRKSRATVYAILLSVLTLIFLCLLYSSVAGPLTDSGRELVIGFGIFFILLITLNIVFVVRAFEKLKRQNNIR
jgi:hypothetical protein